MLKGKKEVAEGFGSFIRFLQWITLQLNEDQQKVLYKFLMKNKKLSNLGKEGKSYVQ